jgi:hypothetical protein
VLPSQRRDSAGWSEIFGELQDSLRLDPAQIDPAPIDPAAIAPARTGEATDDLAADGEAAIARGIDRPEHWLAPIRMEPMTEDEAAQARSLLSAQLIAIDELERRKKATGRHLAVVRSLPGTRISGGPVYLDISG